MWIERKQMLEEVHELLDLFPVVAILGPRQCGKSSFARDLLKEYPHSQVLDLELPSDLRKLQDPELFFEVNRDSIVCLDEIQQTPGIFPILRGEVDKKRRPGRFIILGSASQGLLRQSSEPLAGRIAFFDLTPFHYDEVSFLPDALNTLWFRGSFPDSFLSKSDKGSRIWRKNFIKTFIERDIPQMGFKIKSNDLITLLTLCAHSQGQLVNYSKLAQILEVTSQTVKNHVDLLSGTFIVRILQPYTANTKKRLVKSPKLYLRDQGLLHQLLEIQTFNDLLGHPIVGSSWEGFAIEQIITAKPDGKFSFYRTSNGAEIDLIIEYNGNKIAVEFKCSKSPKISKGFYHAIEDLGITDAWCIIPSADCYPSKQATISGLDSFLDYLKGL